MFPFDNFADITLQKPEKIGWMGWESLEVRIAVDRANMDAANVLVNIKWLSLEAKQHYHHFLRSSWDTKIALQTTHTMCLQHLGHDSMAWDIYYYGGMHTFIHYSFQISIVVVLHRRTLPTIGKVSGFQKILPPLNTHSIWLIMVDMDAPSNLQFSLWMWAAQERHKQTGIMLQPKSSDMVASNGWVTSQKMSEIEMSKILIL